MHPLHIQVLPLFSHYVKTVGQSIQRLSSNDQVEELSFLSPHQVSVPLCSGASYNQDTVVMSQSTASSPRVYTALDFYRRTPSPGLCSHQQVILISSSSSSSSRPHDGPPIKVSDNVSVPE